VETLEQILNLVKQALFGQKRINMYHWLLDNGHGGLVDGKYTTAPNWTPENDKTWHKMHVHNGTPLYEGEFNRKVVDKMATKLSELGINYTVLVPEDEDISLKERVERANAFYKRDKKCIFVSIHGNAFNTSAKGFEVFTSKGLTRSDAIAEVFAIEMDTMFPSQVMRWDLTDGDRDKEANFFVLKNTICPAILTENFFFDHPKDAEIMMSDEGQDKIAQAHVNAILKIEQDGQY